MKDYMEQPRKIQLSSKVAMLVIKKRKTNVIFYFIQQTINNVQI
jgi:hypothetical protein